MGSLANEVAALGLNLQHQYQPFFQVSPVLLKMSTLHSRTLYYPLGHTLYSPHFKKISPCLENWAVSIPYFYDFMVSSATQEP
jgi:hypothetical protein